VTLIRKRQYPLIGKGTRYSSWVHLDDAADAAVLAVEKKARACSTSSTTMPVPANEWLPYLAQCAGAKQPMKVPVWLGRMAAGDAAVAIMIEGRAFDNAKAKREFGWEPYYRSWRQGFSEEFA